MGSRAVVRFAAVLAAVVVHQPLALCSPGNGPSRPGLAEQDPRLRTLVALQVESMPLGKLLEVASARTGVALSAAAPLADQRVSLYAREQPLATLMGRLLALLAHGNWTAASCYWEGTAGSDGHHRYCLRRTMQGDREERDLLNMPLRIATRWLRSLRDCMQLTPEKRRSVETDWPFLERLARDGEDPLSGPSGPVAEALAGLSDMQIDELLSTGSVDLPAYAPSGAASRQLDEAARQEDGSWGAGQPEQRSGAFLSVDPGTGPDDYALTLGFRGGRPAAYPLGAVLDPLRQFPQPEGGGLVNARTAGAGPAVDLLAGLKAPGPGKSAVMSVAAAVDLLGRAARVDICLEVFLKPRQPLTLTRGTVEELLTRICTQYGYRWALKEGCYVVWSRAWAQDRAADVPQARLDRWSAARERQGRLELADLLEMCRLSDRQLGTLRSVYGIGGPFARFNLVPLRLLASLPAGRRAEAFASGGADLGLVTPSRRAALQYVFGRSRIEPPVRVRLEKRPDGVAITFADEIGPSRAGWIYTERRPGE